MKKLAEAIFNKWNQDKFVKSRLAAVKKIGYLINMNFDIRKYWRILWMYRSSDPEVSLGKRARKYTANLQESIHAEVWFQENHTSAWVFYCKFAAYFRNTFF